MVGFGMMLRIFAHLSYKRKVQLVLLVIIQIAGSFAEVISITAIIPFISAIAEGGSSEIIIRLSRLQLIEDLEYGQKMVILVTLIVCLTVLAATVRIFVVWASARVASLVGSDLMISMYREILNQPYSNYLMATSSHYLVLTTVYVNKVVGAIRNLLSAASATFLSIQIVIALAVVNLGLTVKAISCFSICYMLTGWITSERLVSNSRVTSLYAKKHMSFLQESFRSIKDIVMNDSQGLFVRQIKPIEVKYRGLAVKNATLEAAPQFVMEAIGIIGIVCIGYYLVLYKGGSSAGLSELGFFALAMQRLIPSLQAVYRGWSGVQSSSKPINEILMQLQTTQSRLESLENEKQRVKNIGKRYFDKSLRLTDIEFSHSGDNAKVISVENIVIGRGIFTAVVGSSGCGKSTLLDIVMGLVVPSRGNVYFDDVKIDFEYLRTEEWRKRIAYVPQSVFISDSTVIENVRFGSDENFSDIDRLRLATKTALLEDFIESNLEGYSFQVGEFGRKLSGGQKQRLCIARALYRGADLLIMDEATSGLDSKMEVDLLENIRRNYPALTVVLVTHSAEAANFCEKIKRID